MTSYIWVQKTDGSDHDMTVRSVMKKAKDSWHAGLSQISVNSRNTSKFFWNASEQTGCGTQP